MGDIPQLYIYQTDSYLKVGKTTEKLLSVRVSGLKTATGKDVTGKLMRPFRAKDIPTAQDLCKRGRQRIKKYLDSIIEPEPLGPELWYKIKPEEIENVIKKVTQLCELEEQIMELEKTFNLSLSLKQ